MPVCSASVTTGTGSVSGTPSFNANTMTVNLTGVANAQKIVVTVSNVTDAYGRTLASAKVPMGILLGDVVVVSPSCPFALRPQQKAVPPARTAHV